MISLKHIESMMKLPLEIIIGHENVRILKKLIKNPYKGIVKAFETNLFIGCSFGYRQISEKILETATYGWAYAQSLPTPYTLKTWKRNS